MKRKGICIWALFLVSMVTGVRVGAAPVPDTGQTTCYDEAGNVITCPSPGEAYYGQDANYTINPPSYTKLNGMVKDNVTGLIWEVKEDKDGVKHYDNPHDADNTYTWYDPNPATNGGNAGTPGDGTDTDDFLDALNNANFGGYSDWRLPTIKELAYLVNYSIPYPGPTIYTEYFPNTVSSNYWSATTNANNTNNAWNVNFNNGNDNWNNQNNNNYVRAVRGGKCSAAVLQVHLRCVSGLPKAKAQYHQRAQV